MANPPLYYQTIVDRDATAEQAERLGELAIEWLADEHIINDAPSACLPGGRRGFEPAEAWESAIIEIDEYFLGMDVNGVEVVRGRQVFDAGQYEPRPFCPKCNGPRAADADWREAIASWERGDDEATLDCRHCSTQAPVDDWRHDPPIGFGNLGFVFWNWPSLNREFIERLGEVLGHQVMIVEGKL